MPQPGIISISSLEKNPAEFEQLLNDERREDCIHGEETNSRGHRHRRVLLSAVAFVAFVQVFLKRIVPWFQTEVERYQDDRDIPIPDDIVLGRCANWTQSSLNGIDAHSHGAEFYVDTQAPLFVSQGILSKGQITVTQSKEVSSMAKAKVQVGVETEDRKFLEYVQVCEIKPKHGGTPESPQSVHGVGIFSVPWHPQQHGWFSVSVELPRIAGSEGLLNVPSFTSRMPSFVHTFRDVQGVQFEYLNISTTGFPVSAQSLFGRHVHVKNSDAPILGTFNAIERLILETSEGSIDVNLGLHDVSPPCAGTCPEERMTPHQSLSPRARLYTSNGRIRATARLTRAFDPVKDRHQRNSSAKLASEESKVLPNTTDGPVDEIIRDGGHFSINAKTTRGPIAIDFEETPLEHTLRVDAITTFDNVKVSIPPTYGGRWKMKALFPFRDIVDSRADYTDPTGEKRERVLWMDRGNPSIREGAVVWGRRVDSEKTLEGSVEVEAKFGRATIVI